MKMLFRACRILSRKDSEFQTTVLKRNMGIVSKAGKELETSEGSSSRHQRIQKDRHHASRRHMNRVVAENWPSGSSWDSCAEDYIVFHVREDGAISVVEEGEQEASGPLHQIREYSRSVNGKLDFIGKSAESAQQSRESNENEEETESRDLVISENEDDADKESMTIRYHQSETDGGGGGGDGAQGRCSDRSDGSFSFPILGWDWIGSPVEMPRPVGRKPRTHCVRFRCFKF